VFAGATVMALSGQALTDSPLENAPNFQTRRRGHNNYVMVMAIQSGHCPDGFLAGGGHNIALMLNRVGLKSL
jgi:hypothetical protein